MKKKLSKLLRFKTQQFSRQKNQHTKRNENKNFCIKLDKKFSKCFQNQNQSIQKTQVQIQKLNRTGDFFFHNKQKIKLKKGIIKKQLDKQNMTLRQIFFNNTSDNQKNKQIVNNSKKTIINKIKDEIKRLLKLGSFNGIEQLKKIQKIGQQMIQQIYFYNKIQSMIKILNNKSKIIGSKSLIFQVYSFSALILFFYGNYSLSIFYFDKALKKKQQIQTNKIQQILNQVQIYKTVSKIFLQKNQPKIAKQFAYKYLRKAWYSQNIDEQLNAYDILGKIYKQSQQKDMSIYFHNKMCRGQVQNKQIVRLSNYELQKCQKQLKQFAVFQTIQIFVQKDQIFHQMLQNRYKMKRKNYLGQQSQIKNRFFLHTNRSPNRNLNTYRLLQRKLIQEKVSKQLHFIKPKQTLNLKKIIKDFLSLIKNLRTLEFQLSFQIQN